MNLVEKGVEKIEWVGKRMPVLKVLQEEHSYSKPLNGIKIGACLHITAETANLILALKESGAMCFLCPSNPLSTKLEVLEALRNYYNIEVYAKPNATEKEYYEFIDKVLSKEVDITIDDGADLTVRYHANYAKEFQVKFGLEETTTGINRLKALQKEGKLLYPIIAVNNARTKNLFDNRYGTGQSCLDGIIRATNILVAGRTVTVAGYGWCGKGLANKARGLGANVIVCEVDPICALEAVMDGFKVLPIKEALQISDIVCTVTGNINVVKYDDILNYAKDGVILANGGHFNVEIEIDALVKNARKIRKFNNGLIWQCSLVNGKTVYVLGEGRLVNLVCADGHPPEVMDMSFSTQFLSVLTYVNSYKDLPSQVLPVSSQIEQQIAFLKLKTMGITIDTLSAKQKEYLNSWNID